MTDLWLHVNTFFIIVLIFFRYSSHIKKYMAVYFICLCKLTLCSANAFKFVLLFLGASLPGTVKPAPAKLCAAFLCTLLNRLRFSPQNVGFGTKEHPGSGLALSVKPCRACQLSQRESPWHDGKLSGVSANLPVPPEPLPLGEVDANAVSRRRGRGRSPAARLFPQETSAAASVCLYAPSCEKGVQKRPQAFLYPEI